MDVNPSEAGLRFLSNKFLSHRISFPFADMLYQKRCKTCIILYEMDTMIVYPKKHGSAIVV